MGQGYAPAPRGHPALAARTAAWRGGNKPCRDFKKIVSVHPSALFTHAPGHAFDRLKGGFCFFPQLVMENKTTRSKMRRLLKLAYHPGSNPKKPLPGPLYDLTVVGLFVFLAIGLALS